MLITPEAYPLISKLMDMMDDEDGVLIHHERFGAELMSRETGSSKWTEALLQQCEASLFGLPDHHLSLLAIGDFDSQEELLSRLTFLRPVSDLLNDYFEGWPEAQHE